MAFASGVSLDPTTWPAHTLADMAWRSESGRGSREDRMLRQITVSLPPRIAGLGFSASAEATREMERAVREIVATDVGSGDRLSSLGQFLIRTESVSSSKIENIEASMDDYAKALSGIASNESASSMVHSARALQQLVDRAGSGGAIDIEDVLGAHGELMKGDPIDGKYAGQLRTVRNWIGGSDHSPRGAVHIAPPPETVGPYMADLLQFANRDDVPALAQAAIVHAQFESIHPFTDGNGRIGRALINAVLRRRQLTTRTVVPIASAMVSNKQRYFDLVNNYRTGALDAFVVDLAMSAQVASQEARKSAATLQGLPDEWSRLSRPRAGSAAAAILGHLLDHPVLSVEDVERLIPNSSSASVYEAMARLERDGVLHEVTARKRNKVWAASLVLDELDDLAQRIGEGIRLVR